MLKWEHEDRCLHPSSSLNIPATQQGGGWSRNGPEGITVTSQRHLLARRLARPLGRSSAVEQPHFPRVPRGAHALRGTPRTSGGFARRTSLGKGPKRRCAALQRAACSAEGQRVGGRKPASQFLAPTWGMEAQEQSCDRAVSECLAFRQARKGYFALTLLHGMKWG